MTPIEASGWIGDPPRRVQSVATMYVGIIGVMIAGLQPLLLGALEQEGRISASQLGHAATAELLTMGLAAMVAGAWLKPERLRWIGVVAGVGLAGLDWATLQVRGELLTVLRLAAGVPSGMMIWLTIGMVTRSPRPERWSGAYLTLQTLAQFLVSLVLTAFVIGRYGANGGFLALAGVSVLAGLAALLGPDRYAPLAHAAQPWGLPNPLGAIALSACFLFLAFIVAVWVYAAPLSHQAGHPPSVFQFAVTLSLICQVAGGVAATVLAGRLPWFRTLLACAVVDLVLLAVFASLPGVALFLAVSGAFGFIWIFLMPFLVPMVIEADPTRRAAMLMGGAQLLGGSLGPLMASMLVTEDDARGAVGFGAVSLVVAISIVAFLHLRRARGANARRCSG